MYMRVCRCSSSRMREQPAPEFRRRFGKGEERPGEQLGRLQLVIGEGVEDARALRRIGHPLDRRHVDPPLEPQIRRPARVLDPQRRSGVLVGQPGRGRRELAVEVLGGDEGAGELPDLHRGNLPHAAPYW